MAGKLRDIDHVSSKIRDYRFQGIVLPDRAFALWELDEIVPFEVGYSEVLLSGRADHRTGQSIAFVSQHEISFFLRFYQDLTFFFFQGLKMETNTVTTSSKH